jgi:ABC-type molybdenum transport system ATPase subunit/photorepair protein PhrA
MVVSDPPFHRSNNLELTQDERHRMIEGLWVDHSQMRRLREVIKRSRTWSRDAAEPYCLLIYGHSGAGKTTLLQTYAAKDPPVRTEEGVVAPVISATIPVPATMKTMAVALLDVTCSPRM